jgi:hypothetical protein
MLFYVYKREEQKEVHEKVRASIYDAKGQKGWPVNLRTQLFQTARLVESFIASGFCKRPIPFSNALTNQIFGVPQVDLITLCALWHHISPVFATLWHFCGCLWSHIISGYN